MLPTTNQQIQNSSFKDVEFIHARRQPPNLLQQITNAPFVTGETTRIPGITLCRRSNCKICEIYFQECTSFFTANGTEWKIKSEITCHNKNVIYYQVCAFCNNESNTGKTDNLRNRTNNHISCSRNGTGTDIFDHHVYHCSRKQQKPHTEPFFKLFVFMKLSNYHKLRDQERRLHLLNFDTINSTHNNKK